MILLTKEEIKAKRKELKGCGLDPIEYVGEFNKAQLKKAADAIESMTADGWWLEDIVKAIRKEIE